MAACLALNEVGRGSSPRGPNMYLWRSLAAHHLAMVKAPVQIRLGTLVGVDGVAGEHSTLKMSQQQFKPASTRSLRTTAWEQ
jgi:hypothetical protein